jgi:pimeloyl-ACP methyl ester carboxylesterase
MATSHSDRSAASNRESSGAPRARGHERVGGHRLYWEIYGPEEAPTVTLLHHGLGSIRSWRWQIPAFVAEGWQVLAFDRWGYGESEPRAAFKPGFLEVDAREAIGLLQALRLKGTSLVGHSDGGSIALLMAAEHPERVSSLVVVSAHIYVEPKMEAGLEGIHTASQVPPLSAALRRQHGPKADALVRAWLEGWREHGKETLQLERSLASIRAPTLVIQGELDEHASPQHAKDIAAGIEGSELWLIPGVAHMPIHEVPETFNRRVLAFLAGEGQGARETPARQEGKAT